MGCSDGRHLEANAQTMALLIVASVAKYLPLNPLQASEAEEEMVGNRVTAPLAVWALVTQSSVAWQQHVATGNLQPRKYPDNWAGSAAASPTNRLLLTRRQWSPRQGNDHALLRLPARH